MSRLYYSK